MSISLKELMGRYNLNDIPHQHQINLQELRKRLEELQGLISDKRAQYTPFKINSGYRTAQDQARINPAVKNSKHMSGQAADIADPDGELKAVLLANPEMLSDCELWAEDAAHTKTWVHLQIVPPRSGKRWFIP